MNFALRLLLMTFGLWAQLDAAPIEPGPPSGNMLLPRTYVDSICAQLRRERPAPDSMIASANKGIRISQLIGYQKGITKCLMLKGMALSITRNFSAADSIFLEVLASSELDSLQMARVNFNLGRNSYMRREMAKGDSLMLIAKEWAENHPKMLFSIGMNMASRETTRRNYPQALLYLREIQPCLTLLPSEEDSASFYHMLGVTMVNTGQVEEGTAFVQQSLNIFLSINDSMGQSKVYTTLLIFEMMHDNLDSALACIKNSIRVFPTQGDSAVLAAAYRNQGIVLRKLGRQDEALASYWKSHDMNHELGLAAAEIRAKISLGVMYKHLEQNEEAIACFQEASDMPEIQSAPATLATSKANLASLFKEIGNYSEALRLHQEAIALVENNGSPILRYTIYLGQGVTQVELGDLKGARASFETVLAQMEGSPSQITLSETHVELGKLDLKESNFASALNHAKTALENIGKNPDQLNLFNAKVLMADAYFALGNTSQAIQVGEDAWEMAVRLEQERDQRELSEKLSRYYEKTGSSAQALDFSRIYQGLEAKRVATKNEKVIEELRARMELDKKNTEITVLSQQNQLQSAQLSNRKLWIGLLILLALVLLTFFVFWQKRIRLLRRNELLELNLRHTEDKLDLEDAMNEMRLLALQARLNPHFVFNCLVVVQNLTLRGENETALRYLKDFSHLTRMVFEISQKPSLSLSEEIEFLELYIDLENRRLRSQVTVKLELDPAIDPEDIFIPPLLLQPIIENCFKHGFSDEREGQQIVLTFRIEDDFLLCSISDNGKGIVGNTEHNRPSGIRITRKRLEILSKKEASPERLTLSPNPNGPGTQAEMKIPMVSA